MKTKIINYLDKILPDAKCELNYNKDYELLIATMLSAQTTDVRVNQVTKVLFLKYPTIESLANADIEDLKSIIKSVGTFNKKTQNIIDIAKELLKYGYVPNNRIFLESLSGVGRKTTNVVLSNIYHENLIAVDTHVMRVSKRLNIAKENDNPLIIEQKLNNYFKEEGLYKLHHQLVLFGRYYCKAVKPKCDECELKEVCKYYKNKVIK
jgi:endonuclease III